MKKKSIFFLSMLLSGLPVMDSILSFDTKAQNVITKKTNTTTSGSSASPKPKTAPTPKPSIKASPKPKTSSAPSAKKSEGPKVSYGPATEINGMTVRWANNITSAQKSIITDILRDMVYLPYNHYWMGCDDEMSFPDERPPRYVEINAFRISRHEVTQREWTAIMGYNPSDSYGENKPVTNVSYNDCVKFVKKLNELSNAGFKLPNETQWEYAARGGAQSRGYRFSGSDNPNNVGWTSENSDGYLHTVKQKNSNELGLYDMTGNVWEWTSSGWCEDYDSKRDYSSYVIRGGGYNNGPRYARNTNRRHAFPDRSFESLGLRLVVQR